MTEQIVSAFKLGSKQLRGRLINPYQRDGLLWLIRRELATNKKGGFLCDEMGLGKTVQLITLMLANPKPKTLIVMPVSVLNQWKNELNKFAPQLKVFVHHGNNRIKDWKLIPEFNVFLTTYSLFKTKTIEDIIPFNFLWDRVILDEGHEIRSHKSNSYKNCCHLSSDIKWCVTGTPVFNSMKDFVTLSTWIGLDKKYVQANTTSVRKTFVLRRTKEDVSKFNKRLELPPCEIVNKEIELLPEEKTSYGTLFRECQGQVREVMKSGIAEGMKNMVILECFLRVRQFMCHPLVYLCSDDPCAIWSRSAKIDYLIDTLTYKYQNDKSIVFTQFVKEIELIRDRLFENGINTFKIDGSTPQERRVYELKQFEESTSGVILIQIKSGGQGINLQSATRVFITTPAWNPATELQAIGRAHRTGQTQKVIVERLISKGTEELPSIEESIMSLQDHKNIITSEVLNDPRILATLPTKPKNTLTIKTLSKIFNS